MLHCGKVTSSATIDKIAGPQPFARPGEKMCKLKVKLPAPLTFSSTRFILRDGDMTLFLGIKE